MWLSRNTQVKGKRALECSKFTRARKRVQGEKELRPHPLLARLSGEETVLREVKELPRCTAPLAEQEFGPCCQHEDLQFLPLQGGPWLTLVLNGAKASWAVGWGTWEGRSKYLVFSLLVK